MLIIIIIIIVTVIVIVAIIMIVQNIQKETETKDRTKGTIITVTILSWCDEKIFSSHSETE